MEAPVALGSSFDHDGWWLRKPSLNVQSKGPIQFFSSYFFKELGSNLKVRNSPHSNYILLLSVDHMAHMKALAMNEATSEPVCVRCRFQWDVFTLSVH